MDQALVLLNILVKSQNSRPRINRSSSVQQDTERFRTNPAIQHNSERNKPNSVTPDVT